MRPIPDLGDTNTTDASRAFRLTVGPLRYELVGADEWGADALAALAKYVDCRSFAGQPDRSVVYAASPQGLRVGDAAESGLLPKPLRELAAEALPANGWRISDDDTGCLTWTHASAATALITSATLPARFQSRYHFPWHALVPDAAARRGAIVHAALATCRGRAFLFTAPPGGGKTTTMSGLPAGWRLLSDDGCLLWQTQDGFSASPLPTWSHALGVNEFPQGIVAWDVGLTTPVAAALVLNKAPRDALARLEPLDAVSALYRAFSEHPVMLDGRSARRDLLLDLVCSLPEAVPCSELRLTLARADLPRLLTLIADA